MPWFTDGKCVYMGTKGQPGELVKCHGTDAEAAAHLKALYASEQASSAELGTDAPQGTRAAQAGIMTPVAPTELRAAMKTFQRLKAIHKETGDALAQITGVAPPAGGAPGTPGVAPEQGADPTAPQAPAPEGGAFMFDPAALEDRGTEWLYMLVPPPGEDVELGAEPLEGIDGVQAVYAGEALVGFLFDKATFPSAEEVQSWLEQQLSDLETEAAPPPAPPQPVTPEAPAQAQKPKAGQAGRYSGVRDFLDNIRQVLLPHEDPEKTGLTPDSRILLAAGIDEVRSGIYNLHEIENAATTKKSPPDGIATDADLKKAAQKLATFLTSVNVTGTAEALMASVSAVPAFKAGQAAPAVTGAVPMPPGADAGLPNQRARRLFKRAVHFACTSCKTTIRGERHCPGCGASVAEMLRSVLTEAEGTPAAPRPAAPAPVAAVPAAAPPAAPARPARRLLPRVPALPPPVPPAPAQLLLVRPAQNAATAIAEVSTLLQGVQLAAPPTPEEWITGLGGIFAKLRLGVRVSQAEVKAANAREVKELLQFKELTFENEGTDSEWAWGKALVLSPGLRKDGKEAYTQDCIIKSAQNFAKADIWFMHRPKVGQPGSEGLLYDKAGVLCDPEIIDGSLYVTMKVLHPWPLQMIKKAQAAKIPGFYEVSFDGLVRAQEVKTTQGAIFDLIHEVIPRSVDFVDKGAVVDARLIPQAAALQEAPMDPNNPTAPPITTAAPAATAPAPPRPAFLSDEDVLFDQKLAYVQNHMVTSASSEVARAQMASYAVDNRDWLLKSSSAELQQKAKTFALAHLAAPATGVGTGLSASPGNDRIDTCRTIWRDYFNPNSAAPKSLHYAIKCSKAAMGMETGVTGEDTDLHFALWRQHGKTSNRLASRTLGLKSVGPEAKVHSDECYMPDNVKRQQAANVMTLKALQSGTLEFPNQEKIAASQAAIDMAAIAYATQDAMDIEKMERMASVLGGGGLGAPASIAISKDKPVDHTTYVHEVEMSVPDVAKAVAELANYSEFASVSTREWKDKAVLYGGYATISEEARKNDHADVLADLPGLMIEMMLWLEYISVFSPFLNNSLLQDGASVFNSTEGNVVAAGYTFAQYVNLLVLGIQRTDWSVGTGVNKRHLAWSPVGAAGAPSMWAQLTRDTSGMMKPDTTDNASNVVTHGFGGIKNYAMAHFASTGITDRLIVFGDKTKGPIGTMLRYEGRTTPELYIADQRDAPGPGWTANAYQLKIRYGFRYFVKSRKNVVAIVP